MLTNKFLTHVKIQQYNQLRDELMQAYGEHNELINRQLSEETDLQEFAVSLLRERQELLDMAEGCKQRIADIAGRKFRLESAADKIKQLIVQLMEETGTLQFKAPDMTISLRRGSPQVIVTDEDKIPPEYKEIVQSQKILKAKLRDALKGGIEIEGVELSIPENTIMVKTD